MLNVNVQCVYRINNTAVTNKVQAHIKLETRQVFFILHVYNCGF